MNFAMQTKNLLDFASLFPVEIKFNIGQSDTVDSPM